MFSKSLIQFSIVGGSCVPSLIFTWGQTMVEVMKIMVTSFKRSHTLLHSVPPTLQQATPTHTSAGDSWTLMGKSGSVSCRVTAPFSWILVHRRFCVCPSRVLCHTKSLIFQELFVSTAELPWRRAWQPTPVTHLPGESP